MAGLIDIVSTGLVNNTFVCKYPEENFSLGSKLIVDPTQQAFLINEGTLIGPFESGRHNIETNKIPIFNKIFNLVTKDNYFQSKVYFINMVEHTDIRWGTSSRQKIRFAANGNAQINIGANGVYAFKPCDSEKLLRKLVGNDTNFTDEISLNKLCRTIAYDKLTDGIGNVINDLNISVLDLDSSKSRISSEIKPVLAKAFEEYGLELTQFAINSFLYPESGDDTFDIFNKIKILNDNEVFLQGIDAEEDRADRSEIRAAAREAKKQQAFRDIQRQTEVADMDAESEALARKRAREGYTYQQEQAFGVANTLAANEATGTMTNMGIGLGTMAGTGVAMAGMLSNAISGMAPDMGVPAGAGNAEAAKMVPESQAAATIKCSKCGADVPANGKFCLECGEKIVVLQPNEVVCKECGKVTPKGKFCMECGAPMIRKCAGCGAELPENAKFCLECGEKA